MKKKSATTEWASRGKTISQLIAELQTFENKDMEVRISIDDGATHKGISLVERNGAYCLLLNCCPIKTKGAEGT